MEAFIEKCVEYKEIQDEVLETASAFFDHNTGAPRQGKHMPVFQSKAFTFRGEDEPVVAAYTTSFTDHEDDDKEEEEEEGGKGEEKSHRQGNEEDNEDQVATDNPTVSSDDGDDDENSTSDAGEQEFEESVDEHDYVVKK